MPGHLTASVIDQGALQLLRQVTKLAGKGTGYMIGLLALEGDEDGGSGGDFHQCANSRMVARADDEITLPVARNDTVGNFRWSFGNADQIRDGAVLRTAFPLLSPSSGAPRARQ